MRWRQTTLGRVVRLATALLALLSAAAHGASSRAYLALQVKPEAVLARRDQDSLLLKIRLHAATHARLWRGDSCTAPPPDAFVVSKSGSHVVPLSVLAGQGGKACLLSDDGALKSALWLAPAGQQ